jgi:hypothetical protein
MAMCLLMHELLLTHSMYTSFKQLSTLQHEELIQLLYTRACALTIAPQLHFVTCQTVLCDVYVIKQAG